MNTLSFFVIAPWLSIVPVAAFGALYFRATSRLALATAVLWLAYGVYESMMYMRILCSGECNIRIDLLLIHPLLLLLSLAAIVVAIWSPKRNGDGGDD